MRVLLAGAAALIVAAGMAAAAAAFTLESVPGAAGSQNLSDPDELAPIQHLTAPPGGSGNGSGGSYSLGNSGLSFSITGGSSSVGSGTYFDGTRPPPHAPFGLGLRPPGSNLP